MKYVILLRGINVGGHKKVQMAKLREVLTQAGYSGVKTLLASGNVVLESPEESISHLENRISALLETAFGFSIPVLVRMGEDILNIIREDPFKDIEVHKDIRLYVTFLRNEPETPIEAPWASADGSYRILAVKDRMLLSVLDISVKKTVDAMQEEGKALGKEITTRNWNTVIKIGNLLQ